MRCVKWDGLIALPLEIPAIHRQGNALEQSGIRPERRVRPDLQLLNGQARRVGGGVGGKPQTKSQTIFRRLKHGRKVASFAL